MSQVLVGNNLVPLVVARNIDATPVLANLTAVNNAVTVPLTGFNTATFAFQGTFSGFNASFEVSYDGGTTWLAISALPVNSTSLTYVLATGVIAAANAYVVEAPGATHARARTTAIASGTVNAIGTASVSR